jgi:chorismate dehydratase
MITIGHIQYANCTPIFTALLRDHGHYAANMVGGVPAELNLKLRNGDIDVCPSSSIEYGKHPDKYFILPDLSISSVGPVQSVLLFSRVPIEELNGKSVGLTTDSDTSVNLLRILLARQCGFHNEFIRTGLPLREALGHFSALLLIGDAALRESMAAKGVYVYDLGELWFRYTGLPFVFALWLVTRQAVIEKREQVASLLADLLTAKQSAYRSYDEIAATCQEREWMSREALAEYWNVISYELTPDHLLGLRTFYRYAAEVGILSEEPVVELFTLRGC